MTKFYTEQNGKRLEMIIFSMGKIMLSVFERPEKIKRKAENVCVPLSKFRKV